MFFKGWWVLYIYGSINPIPMCLLYHTGSDELIDAAMIHSCNIIQLSFMTWNTEDTKIIPVTQRSSTGGVVCEDE